jgi:hypothetical protein
MVKSPGSAGKGPAASQNDAPVVPCAQVKEPLKLPFLFLFILLCVLLVFSALDILATWGMDESGTHAFSLGYAIARLPRSAFEAMLPSVVLSLVVVGMRMARRPFSRFLGLLICLAVSYAALVNGMIWLGRLDAKARPAQAAAARYFTPRGFTGVGSALVGVESIEGGTLRGVLVVRMTPPAGGSRFSVFPRAEAAVSNSTVTVTTADRRPLQLTGTPALSRDAVFGADVFTRFFLRDIGVLTSDFERLLAASLPEFFAACFALLFLCTASFVLLRASRWPLLNVLLLLLAVRGYAALWHLLSVAAAPRVARYVADALLVRMFPSAVMAILAAVLLLIDILFIPADRWKQLEES